MPPRRASTSAGRSTDARRDPRPSGQDPRPSDREARRQGRRPGRIGWDRQLRLLMLGVLGLVAWVGIHAATGLLATREQAIQERALVTSLTRQNRSLERQAASLVQLGTILRDARSLGMVRTTEQPYVVTGLPRN